MDDLIETWKHFIHLPYYTLWRKLLHFDSNVILNLIVPTFMLWSVVTDKVYLQLF